MSFSLEMMFEIWNDQSGEHLEIGPDRDGLDLIEIRSKDEEGKTDARISFSKEQAALVARALQQLADL